MKHFVLVLAFLLAGSAFAKELIINGAEFGIGKFHRQDNKEHAYEANNAWKVFILPEGISADEAYIQKNSSTNYTIFFTNLQEFLEKIVELSQKTKMKVSVLNLNAHGLPGGMWFPVDAKTRDSFQCMSWRDAAKNSDQNNYEEYYSPVSKSEMQQFDSMSNGRKIPSYQCLTGVNEWAKMVAKVPDIKTVFTDNAQIHMLSCIVGMGTLGDEYTQGLAGMLFANPVSQQVQTSIKFGLGDWSMPEGMGFWGYESDDQLRRDNSVYPIHRRDSEIMQKGSIRVAQVSGKQIGSGLMNLQDYIILTHDDRAVDYGHKKYKLRTEAFDLPTSVRIPGTKVRIQVK